MKQNITLGLAVLALVVGVFGLNPDVKALVDRAVQDASSSFGALAGPDIQSRYLAWGGIREYRTTIPITQATTTPCAIQSPAATSTLLSAGIKLDVSSSTATTWDIARSNTAFATTTAVGTAYVVGAGAQALINASTSPAAGAAEVFSPNQWLVFGVRAGVTPGSNGAGFVPVGACHASFEEYPTL